MAQWKDLPATLDPRVRHLVVRLRQLKDHSGLSVRALAGRTGFGVSSWERYLHGKAFPPREAVAGLARLTGADPHRLLALYDVAADSRESPGAGGTPPPGPAPARRTGPLLAAAVLVPLTAIAGLLLIRPGPGQPAAGEFAYEPGRTHSCDVRRSDGRLSAGHSDTGDAVLQQIATGWEVVEAQCLLEHHGYRTGGVDGAYGALTERAVRRLQRDGGVVVDGIVGEHTWEVLRR
ncbi:hypothetical protein GCM10009716_15590 [Streptomyces sodiiphilus]|uniref:HTH cro/C1-type domain-containing protein n=1 Tax=Streptomyces sodiiphilus TaxID=226217 RepID=A0ABP5A814_9ACTN